MNDPEPDATFDRIARLAGALAQAPLAMVTFINDERQMFRGLAGSPAAAGDRSDREDQGVFDVADIVREAPLDYGFCPQVVGQGSHLALDDVADYPHFKANAFVQERGVRSYLGIPLVDPTGMTLGAISVADVRPRRWGPQHVESMQDLAETLLPEFQMRDSLLAQQLEMFAVFDGAPFPIMLTQGPDHLLRYANARQGSAFGRVRQLSPGRRVLPGLDAVGVFQTMDRAYHTGQTSTLTEARIASYDASSPQTFLFTCTPVRLTPKAPVSGVLTMAVNVTAHSRSDGGPQLAADFTSQVEQLGSNASLWPSSGQQGQQYESSV